MFTGIIERTGTIIDARQVSGGKRLRIDVGPIAAQCELGASVSVQGVCLTVVRAEPSCLEFDVIKETLDKSTLGQKRRGDPVNIERSLRVGDRLDGHFVQGHVDGAAVVDQVMATPQETVLWFRTPDPLARFIIPKGSIAVDGVSLTIAEVEPTRFSVALIPTTLERTTLSSLRSGDVVNLETDIIVRTIVHRLSQMTSGETTQTASGEVLTLSQLQEAGFA